MSDPVLEQALANARRLIAHCDDQIEGSANPERAVVVLTQRGRMGSRRRRWAGLRDAPLGRPVSETREGVLVMFNANELRAYAAATIRRLQETDQP